MSALRRCRDGVFEVALARRRRQGREGRGGTTRFARCGRPGWCWPSRRGRRTMARWDYSTTLLLQVYSTLPFDAAPRCDGGNRAGVLRILQRPGWGECGLPSLGGAVHLCLPPDDGGAAGRVGAVAVWRRGGAARGGPLGSGSGINGKGTNDGGGAD